MILKYTNTKISLKDNICHAITNQRKAGRMCTYVLTLHKVDYRAKNTTMGKRGSFHNNH